MEDREEPPPHPWQAKCEIRDLLSWLFDILYFLLFSTLQFFFIFQDVFDFLTSIDIHGVRIHYHFLSFILSVG